MISRFRKFFTIGYCLYLFSLLIIAIQFSTLIFIRYKYQSWQDRANVGDLIGGVGSFISGISGIIGLGGILYTLYLQQKAIEQQQQSQAHQSLILQQTIELNALNILAEAYNSKIKSLSASGKHFQNEQQKLDQIIENLEILIEKDKTKLKTI